MERTAFYVEILDKQWVMALLVLLLDEEGAVGFWFEGGEWPEEKNMVKIA